jgi:hypothetical protein
MNEIILPYASLKYVAPIIYCKYNKGAELGIPEIKELLSCIGRLAGKKSYLLFIDLFSFRNTTNEGKKKLKEQFQACKGVSIFINKDREACTQGIANTFNTMNSPVRVFTSGQDAIDWLFTLPS